MNEKIIYWIAVGVILFSAASLDRNGWLSNQQYLLLVLGVVILGVIARVIGIHAARRMVKSRRRMYKEFWRRGDSGEEEYDHAEEEALALLGRIKGAKFMGVLIVGGVLVALYFQAHLFALVLALGNAFLALRLYYVARSLEKILPPDNQKQLSNIQIPSSNSGFFLVELNVMKYHDFIKPRIALPFWSLREALWWLEKCGFTQKDPDHWSVEKNNLNWLDEDEIISIQPLKDL
ncbi:MAG: hypothetical protein H6563_15105 [Lewinellaceae bacterium]|nr:hypothetical protein [Lewinellaceae bacterium]